MPAEAVHLTALHEATTSPALSPSARRRLQAHRDAARLGAILVDLPYFHGFAGELVRHALKLPAKPSPWGARLHDEGPVGVLHGLVAQARRTRDDAVAALALGLASHVVIDRALHPLVNALARTRGGEHGASHRHVETFHSICFHEAYMGKDMMGTLAVRRWVAVGLAGTLDRHPVGEALARAVEGAFGEVLPLAHVARWGRSYGQYAWLLASPLGKTVAPPSAKERERPRFCSGAWGRFDELLAQAIARSVAAIDAVAAAIDASRADQAAADARLARELPHGSIDGAGHDVDLASPYRIEVALGG